MDHRIEHYSELHCRENIISSDALHSIQYTYTIYELDSEPILGEVMYVLTPGKAPEKDGISIRIIRCASCTLMGMLYMILCQCWREGSVLQDMRDAHIITLYKNKGDRSDCNSYQGISLLNTMGKLFTHDVLKRLWILNETVYPESQHGFWCQRLTVDIIFSLRHLQEKCREQRKPPYITFIDLTKALNPVCIDGLLQILTKIRCPSTLHSVIKLFHDGMKENHCAWWSHIRLIWYIKWSQVGTCTGPNPVSHFFKVMLKHTMVLPLKE